MRTSQQVNEFIKCKKIYCFLAARPLFAGCEAASRGGVASAATSPEAPSAARAGDGDLWGRTSRSPRPSPLLGAGAGGSKLRRNLSSLSVATPLAPFQHTTPPQICSTGTVTVAPASPCDNQKTLPVARWMILLVHCTQQDVGLHESQRPAGKLACQCLLALLCHCSFSPETYQLALLKAMK